jgi:hypothetical protein
MTSPFAPPSEDDKLKRHLEKGGKITLESKQTFPAPAATVEGSEPVQISFPGTQRLADKMQSDYKVRLNLTFTFAETPEFALLAFLNTPGANANTPAESPGFVGPIGFFGHEGHHGETTARLSAGVTVKRVSGGAPITLTLVPAAYPARAFKAQTVQVKASLELLQSKVEKLR